MRRFAVTSEAPVTNTIICTTGMSREATDWTRSLPTPGQEKTFSVMTAPATSVPRKKPRIVRIESMALGSAWSQMILRSGRPRMRAALTHGRRSASIMALRA